MASAFIIQVQPQLQRDPNEETAALLRVLIHKIDNTTFGSDVPALPQWTGPARMAVHVQFILYASLAASLLSAFLAMLGKQWLNRYASIDMRGSAIERSQNRQRKLDGIITWYFEHVLECLPLMLQVALLLLGCALSRYLWEINTAVASVVIGVTSLGMVFYFFIIVAGVTSDGCPYQTPWTNIILRLLHLYTKHSKLYSGPSSLQEIRLIVLNYPIFLLYAFAFDVFQLGQGIFRLLIVSPARGVRSWLFRTSPVSEQALDYQETKLDLRCISWTLRTSLDKTINLLTFNFLKTILATPDFNPDIVVDCFDVFSNCFTQHNGISITRGSEQLADISAMCFLCTFSSFLITTPTSSTIENARQRYKIAFPVFPGTQYPSYPFYVKVIHHLFRKETFYLDFFWRRPYITWMTYNPPSDELVLFSHALAQVAQSEYQSRENMNRKVPRWLLRFALRFLSQDPLPPTPVVVDCLTIIATDLDCNVSGINSITSDEKCVHTPNTTVSLLTLHQHTA